MSKPVCVILPEDNFLETIYFAVGEKGACIDWFKDVCKLDRYQIESLQGAGDNAFMWALKGYRSIIWLRKMDIYFLIHEVSHFVFESLSSCDIMLNKETTETHACYAESTVKRLKKAYRDAVARRKGILL